MGLDGDLAIHLADDFTTDAEAETRSVAIGAHKAVEDAVEHALWYATSCILEGEYEVVAGIVVAGTYLSGGGMLCCIGDNLVDHNAENLFVNLHHKMVVRVVDAIGDAWPLEVEPC